MRTDPRAEEVRAIVKTFFAQFLPENRQFVQPQEATDETRNKHGSRCEAAFPRLYRPVPDSAEYPCNGPKIDETILIDEGRYVARSYRAAGCLAMWLVSAGILQFYDRSGEMLATINLFESLRPERMAA